MVYISFWTHPLYNHVNLFVKRLMSLFGINALGKSSSIVAHNIISRFLYLLQISLYHFVVHVNLERALHFLLFLATIFFYHLLDKVYSDVGVQSQFILFVVQNIILT